MIRVSRSILVRALVVLATTGIAGCGGDDDGQPPGTQGGGGGAAGSGEPGQAGEGNGGGAGAGATGGEGASAGTAGEGGIGASSGVGGRGGSSQAGGSSGTSGTSGDAGAPSGGVAGEGGASGGQAGQEMGGGGAGGTGAGGTGAGAGGTSAGMGGASAGMGGTVAGTGGVAGSSGTGGGGPSCIRVAPNGDDALATASSGAYPFRNVQPAIDYAYQHPSGPQDVCLSQGSTCGSRASYAGPSEADLTMRDGVSVYGDYESTTWSRCAQWGTTLVPGTGNGVYFGPGVQSETRLDRFTIARFAAETTSAVTLDGALGAVLSNLDVGTAAVGATTTIGVDVRNGADAELDGITMSIQSLGGGFWSPPHQFGVRVAQSKIDMDASNITLLGQGQSVRAVSLMDAGESAVTGTMISLFSSVETHGIHVERSPGVVLDGTHLTLQGDGLNRATSSTGAVFIDSPNVSWLGSAVSIQAALANLGLWLDDSPGAVIDTTLSLSATFTMGCGIALQGDSTGTTLSGSVTLENASLACSGVWVADCTGGPLQVDMAVDVVASTTRGEGIHVEDQCDATLSGAVTVRGVSTNTAQALTGIRCVAPSRCAVDGDTVRILGSTTMPGANITATGILCDPGSCVSITASNVSGLSQPGELRNSRYSGGGVIAPGSTLVSGNVIDAGCSGSDGVGLQAAGRIENNVITGPTCGGSFVVPTGLAKGLLLNGNADVHSNTIASGGALDGVPFGQLGCESLGVAHMGGLIAFRNNIVIASACTQRFPFRRFNGAPNPTALEHNDFLSSWVLYLDGPAGYATTAEINALPYASGNFSAEPALDSEARLTSGSPCVDAGTASGAPAMDRDGDLRDQTPDVGADEWTGAPSACRGVSCSNHGVCFVSEDVPTCSCDPSYVGPTCAISNPCGAANGGCDPRTVCIPTQSGERTCGPCPSGGYDGDGETGCIDVDECALGQDDCVEPATCVNVDGTFTCVCPDGSFWDTDRCRDIDECTQNHGGCDPVAPCINTQGGHYCGSCPSGYTGSGDTACVDIDECQTDQGGCDPLVTCINTVPGRICGPCPEGYAGDGEAGCLAPCQPGHMGPACNVVFSRLSAKEYQNCGLRSDGAIKCWGDNEHGQSAPPSGSYVAVSVGHKHTCGVRSDGTIDCWGYGFFGLPPGSDFVDVATSYDHSCGVESTGNVVCWGDTSGGKATPPNEPFKFVAVGAWHSCGLRDSDSSVVCWGLDDGLNDHGQAAPPSMVPFLALDIYLATTCGIDDTGELLCWGYDQYQGAALPAGPFSKLALGSNFGCAIRSDGTLACWGENGQEQATPPPGSFKDIAAGDYHACALRVDDDVLCWGFDVNGDTVPPAGGS